MTGDIGENLANVFLSRKTDQGHLFRTTLIAGKWPTIDIYAEVIGGDSRMFCFFQIKTTEQGYTKREHKLKVGVDKSDLIKLSNYYAPSYLIGIDYVPQSPFTSRAYIMTIRGNYTDRVSSISTVYELNEANLILLKDEVVNFWDLTNNVDVKANYLTNFGT